MSVSTNAYTRAARLHEDMAREYERKRTRRLRDGSVSVFPLDRWDRHDEAIAIACARVEWVLALESLLRWLRTEDPR